MKPRWVTLILLVVLSAPWNGAQVNLVETRNAALRYWMAFAEVRDPPADKSIQDLLEKTSSGKATWDESRLGGILDSNREALQTMLLATKLPDCDRGLEYGRGPRAPIAYLARARVLARLNMLQGIREMKAGESQGAVERWIAGVRFSVHLANGGTLIAALTAKSVLLPNLQRLTEETRKGRLTSSQTKQALMSVQSLPEAGLDWTMAWEIEGRSIEAFLRDLQGSKRPKMTYEASYGRGSARGSNDSNPPGVGRIP